MWTFHYTYTCTHAHALSSNQCSQSSVDVGGASSPCSSPASSPLQTSLSQNSSSTTRYRMYSLVFLLEEAVFVSQDVFTLLFMHEGKSPLSFLSWEGNTGHPPFPVMKGRKAGSFLRALTAILPLWCYDHFRGVLFCLHNFEHNRLWKLKALGIVLTYM